MHTFASQKSFRSIVVLTLTGVIGSILLAFGPPENAGDPAKPSRPTPELRVPLAITQLEGSDDYGDIGPFWAKELKLEPSQHLLFRWKTNFKGAVGAKWEVLNKKNQVLKSGQLKGAPAIGEWRQFSIVFEDISLDAEPRVRLAPFDRSDTQPVWSNFVVILKSVPGAPVKFKLPITDMLIEVRDQFDVPALAGATVTTDGIDVIDSVGIRKHGSPTPVTNADRWHLGSDTKAMTATLLAVLVQKGKADWDMTVADVFPEWVSTMDARFHQVTFEHLMAHRAGIMDQTAAESSALTDNSKSITGRRREFTRLITHRSHDDGALFSGVGATFRYQNSNFIIAGAMMEKITGKSWEDLMKKEIFEPLGMTSAGFGAPGSESNVDQPWGHSDASGQRVATKSDNAPAIGPAGTVHASLADWGRFIRLHLDGSEGSLTLQPSVLSRLHTQFSSGPMVSDNRYGWGWLMFGPKASPNLGHDGSNTSWYCSCQVYPGKGVAFLAVANIGGNNDNGPDFGKGDQACWKVIELLAQRYFF